MLCVTACNINNHYGDSEANTSMHAWIDLRCDIHHADRCELKLCT